MSAFLTSLDVSLIDETANEYRGLWRLDAPLVYQSDVAAQNIVAPAGMVTDFESCPRLPVVFFLVGEVTREAAVVHDHLYKSKLLPRSVADKVLLEACAVSGIPAWRRTLIYWGVRIGGASHFGT